MTASVAALLPRAFALAVALFAPAAAHADVRVTDSMAQALAEAAPDTLVVVDLDNTLIRPTTGLGSDEWFYHLEERIAADEGLSEAAAADRAMDVWNDVQARIHVQPVEPGVPALLRSLQRRNVRVLGLTARTHEIAEVTRRQLASVGIDLAAASPRRAPWRARLRDVARYRDGIVFVGEHNDKGEVLAAFLRELPRRPGRVLFVDDRDKHVRAVDVALSRAGIPCVAFRYGAADDAVARFDAPEADRQYEALAHAE